MLIKYGEARLPEPQGYISAIDGLVCQSYPFLVVSTVENSGHINAGH